MLEDDDEEDTTMMREGSLFFCRADNMTHCQCRCSLFIHLWVSGPLCRLKPKRRSEKEGELLKTL